MADYLNVDPLLIRAGFAALMIFGGAGLVLYVVGWLLIPLEQRNDDNRIALHARLPFERARGVRGSGLPGHEAVVGALVELQFGLPAGLVVVGDEAAH